jgi:hypothetical protein
MLQFITHQTPRYSYVEGAIEALNGGCKWIQLRMKEAAYDEIWGMCSAFLYDESEVVYLSMFGYYEISEQRDFIKKCREAYNKWEKRIEEKCATEKGGTE